MGFIEWTAALSIGIDEIDEQHKVLVGLINRLEEARASGIARKALGSIVSELGEYAQTHFALEEKRFEECSYPGVASHKVEHDVFVARMVEFERAFAKRKEEVSSELLTFLRVWLTRHISFSDRKYKPYLIRKR